MLKECEKYKASLVKVDKVCEMDRFSRSFIYANSVYLIRKVQVLWVTDLVETPQDEFHTRLRFCRRDLIAMANFGKDDNGSQFFFTLNSTPDLQNKHTILDENDRPFYPPRMIKTIILNNPFSDIISRIIVEESEEVKDNSKTKTAGVKYKSYMFAEFRPDSIILCNEKFCYRDFNLLSFGKEAEEDDEESVILNKKFSGKGKSDHDHLTDPK
ncbi:Peptidyl-prolyl isomerase cwc27 [Eufriesea mexicana]|nr:Peptidyl-prolyl isomerase cwc27 [Eufriesea mexicana]